MSAKIDSPLTLCFLREEEDSEVPLADESDRSIAIVTGYHEEPCIAWLDIF